MRTQVETKIARADELAVELREATIFERNPVVDEKGSEQAEGGHSRKDWANKGCPINQLMGMIGYRFESRTLGRFESAPNLPLGDTKTYLMNLETKGEVSPRRRK